MSAHARRRISVFQLTGRWYLWCPTCRIGDIRPSWRSAFDGANLHAGSHVSEPPC